MVISTEHSDRFSEDRKFALKSKFQNEKDYGRVWSYRGFKYHHQKARREIFRMGMVSGVLVFKGFATVGFFLICGPFFFDRFSDRFKCHENAKRTCSNFGFSS